MSNRKTKIWRTADGRDIQVRQMESDHIKRSVIFILRSMQAGVPRRTKFLIPLIDELNRRGEDGMYFASLRQVIIKERLKRKALRWLIDNGHDAPLWDPVFPSIHAHPPLSFRRS